MKELKKRKSDQMSSPIESFDGICDLLNLMTIMRCIFRFVWFFIKINNNEIGYFPFSLYPFHSFILSSSLSPFLSYSLYVCLLV